VRIASPTTTLPPIIGYGELLISEFNGDDKRHTYVSQIVQAGYRARDLVRQLLAFGRKQTLEYRNANLNDVVRNFESLLRRTIRENIDMTIVAAPQELTINADIGQIEQVIMNLVVNAQDAMPTGGKLFLKTRPGPILGGYIEEEAKAISAPGVVLSIIDTGCGMDEATKEHIFEPFFSTKGDRGTGLGLATVYGIVKQHGGQIQVVSELGKGTAFNVFLPMVVSESGEEISGEAAPSETTGSETILLVEDSESVRDLSHDILKRLGYNVMVAANGKDALSVLRYTTGYVDLVLTDVVMPDMNGKELYAVIAEKHPQIRVLFMSGYTDDVIADHGVLEKGVQFIQKPFSIQELAAKVRSVLDHKPAM
jgi:two-component system cell cycle sensor histidine kinase/response regulator CckA